jgi:CheY-like chemotaxis protein
VNRAQSQGTAGPRFLPAGALVPGAQGQARLGQLPAKTAGRPVTILVVDDEPRMRRLARRMLSEMGYQVLEAENADVAARLLDTQASIDLLFTDVVMPGGMDGRALGHWARQAHPGLGVLLTSGFAQHTAGVEPPGAEPLPMLSKPYSKEQLQESVRTLLGAQRS